MSNELKVKSAEEIQMKIEFNRDRIEKFLSDDSILLPLDVIYYHIRTIASQNERLIEKLNNI